MDVDGLVPAIVGVPPHLPGQRIAGEDTARMLGEQPYDVEFGARQRHDIAAEQHLVRLRVHDDVAESQQAPGGSPGAALRCGCGRPARRPGRSRRFGGGRGGCIRPRRATAQHRTHAFAHHAQRIRFGHVIVGEQGEPLQLMPLVIKRGGHDDRHVAAAPDRLADGEPVQFRQQDIDDHQIHTSLTEAAQPLFPVDGRQHVVAVMHEQLFQHVQQLRLVLDDQQSCHRHRPCIPRRPHPPPNSLWYRTMVWFWFAPGMRMVNRPENQRSVPAAPPRSTDRYRHSVRPSQAVHLEDWAASASSA